MDSQAAGPSRPNNSERNIFQSFQQDNNFSSDEDDDFQIPHVSDDSGSSSNSDDDIDPDLNNGDLDWRSVDDNSEIDIDLNTPNFTVRNSNMPNNLPDRNLDPLDFFMLFFDNTSLANIVRHTNAYAQNFLSQPATLAWID